MLQSRHALNNRDTLRCVRSFLPARDHWLLARLWPKEADAYGDVKKQRELALVLLCPILDQLRPEKWFESTLYNGADWALRQEYIDEVLWLAKNDPRPRSGVLLGLVHLIDRLDRPERQLIAATDNADLALALWDPPPPAAATYYNTPDFMLDDNASTKLHYGYFQVYMKTVVTMGVASLDRFWSEMEDPYRDMPPLGSDDLGLE